MGGQTGAVLDRIDSTKGFLGSVLFVSMKPFGRHVAQFLQAVEHTAVEHLGAVDPVESFNVGVLRGLAGLDVLQGDSLALLPLGQRSGDELRAVQVNRWQRAEQLHQLVQGPDDECSSQAGVKLNAQPFAVEIIEDVELPEPPPRLQRIGHLVAAQELVGLAGGVQVLFDVHRRPLLAPLGQVQQQLAVHAQEHCIVPKLGMVAGTFEQQPEAVERAQCHVGPG